MVHDFDPALVHLPFGTIYWYGARFSAGFLALFLWFVLRRQRLGLTLADCVNLRIAMAIGTLIGGRAFDILVYELDYYRDNPLAALNWWNGGMASHGGMLGASLAIWAFARSRRMSFLALVDEIVVPAVFLLAIGRIGNFIVGGVIGTPTGLPWGVTYADVVGARHPVALYESAKNLAIVPVLIVALRRWPAGRGVVMSLFVLLYAGLRFLVDLYRDYEATWLGMDTGQIFNLAMTAIGLCLLAWFLLNPRAVAPPPAPVPRWPGWPSVLLLLALIVYPLGIPNSWTKVNIDAKRQTAAPAEVSD